MKTLITSALRGVVLLTALHASTAHAAWPEKPVSFIVPSAAGGSPDVLSRLVTNHAAQALKTTFVVENRPGAAGNIGIVQVKRAAPDGYIIGYGNVNTLAVNRSLFNTLPYDVDADLVPVAHMVNLYNVMLVPSSSPYSTVQQVIDAARAKPGALSYGASGVGTTGHMGGELFSYMAKIDVMHVPYNGGPAALQDLLGGRLDFMFVNSSEAFPLVNSGKARALGVSSLKRLEQLPDVPTLDESGLRGYETIAWGGVVAPKGTPLDVVNALNLALNTALRQPEVRQGLKSLGAEPVGGSPEAFKKLIDDETVKWRSIIESAKIEKLN